MAQCQMEIKLKSSTEVPKILLCYPCYVLLWSGTSAYRLPSNFHGHVGKTTMHKTKFFFRFKFRICRSINCSVTILPSMSFTVVLNSYNFTWRIFIQIYSYKLRNICLLLTGFRKRKIFVSRFNILYPRGVRENKKAII